MDERTQRKNGTKGLTALNRGLGGDDIRFIIGTYHGLDFAPAVDEHAHAMSSRLIASTVVGQNKRKVHRMFICIREKVPLMLGLIMDFVGITADGAKLSKK